VRVRGISIVFLKWSYLWMFRWMDVSKVSCKVELRLTLLTLQHPWCQRCCKHQWCCNPWCHWYCWCHWSVNDNVDVDIHSRHCRLISTAVGFFMPKYLWRRNPKNQKRLWHHKFFFLCHQNPKFFYDIITQKDLVTSYHYKDKTWCGCKCVSKLTYLFVGTPTMAHIIWIMNQRKSCVRAFVNHRPFIFIFAFNIWRITVFNYFN
jgi:hypothetical protein